MLTNHLRSLRYNKALFATFNLILNVLGFYLYRLLLHLHKVLVLAIQLSIFDLDVDVRIV